MAGRDGHPRAGRDYPRDWRELLAWFPDDEACLEYIAGLRWPEGFACPRCGERRAWRVRRGLLRCSSCRHESSVTAGTVLAGTRTPLTTWFAAAWYVTNQKSGVSALGLQRVLSLGSYQTAWTMLHKLRRAMVRPGRERLSGEVEADERYVGGEEPGGARRHERHAIVAIAAECRPRGRTGRVRMARVPDVSGQSLPPFVESAVAPGSVVLTDGWPSYARLPQLGYAHRPTSLRASGDPAHVVMPRVHRVSSLLKRWLLGTHQGAVGHAHLDDTLNEFTFRFNRRRARHRGLLFYRLLEQAVATDPTPYASLVAPRR
jgi:transposase-like protein